MQLKEGGFTAKQVFEAGFNIKRLRQAGYSASEISRDCHCTNVELKHAGFTATQLKVGVTPAPFEIQKCNIHEIFQIELIQAVGCLASDLRLAGCKVQELKDLYSSEELQRAGYTKDELKPQGVWPHDGQWQIYNQYWSCCFGLDKASPYCVPLHSSRQNSTEVAHVSMRQKVT